MTLTGMRNRNLFYFYYQDQFRRDYEIHVLLQHLNLEFILFSFNNRF